MATSPRPLRLGSFAISGDLVIAVDDAAPVVIEVDIASGELRTARTWEVPPFSGRPVANDVEVVDGSIVIASPAAGGVVYIDRDTGNVTTIALDAPIGQLVADGSTVWAIADPDWNDEPRDHRLGRRPVVWEEPTEAQIAEYRAEMARWSRGDSDFDDEDDEPAFDWRNQPDDGTDIIDPPTPVWRIRGGVAERVEFGGQLVALVPIGDRVVAVCILPTDPIVKTIDPGGSLGFGRPASLLLGTPESGFERVTSVPESGASVFAAGDRALLLEPDLSDTDHETLRWFDPADQTFSNHLPVDFERPVAAVGTHIIDLPRRRPPVLRVIPLDGGAAASIPIPEVDVGWSSEVNVVGRSVWFRKDEDNAVIGVDVDAGTIREVALAIDCAAYLPSDAPTTAAARASITLPVMLATWELECCQPHAVVGEPWTALPLLGAAEQWWMKHAPDPVPEEVRDFGIVEFEGTVLRPARNDDEVGLVATGPIRLAVKGVGADQQHFRGTIDHDAHGEAEGVLESENEATGVVRRIQGVEVRWAEGSDDAYEEGMVPVGQEPPVELQSTADAGEFNFYVLTIEFSPGATV